MKRNNKNTGLTFKTLLVLLLLPITHLPLLAKSERSKSVELHQLFERDWQARLDRSPEFAESVGVITAADKLTDVSETGQQAWLKTTNQFLVELNKIDFNKLSGEDQINYQIFEQQLANRQALLKFKDYQVPFLADSGFHTRITRLPIETKFKYLKDYQLYIKRLENIPAYFQQNIDNMNAGLKRNFSMPKIVMTGFTDVIKQQIKPSAEESPFFKPFDNLPASLSQSERRLLKSSAKQVIERKVIPAFRELAVYFETIYIPGAQESLAAYDLPNGSAFYRQQIKEYTTGNLTPEAIHQIGLKEVARIRAEMEEIIKSLNFKGDFKQFLKFLRESPQFYAKTPEELIKEASYIAKKMDGQLPKFFTKLPRQPYAVEPVPEAIAPKYTTGRYVSAPLESTRPGTYWVNTYALDKRPLYVLESLTLHEAVPGHHLQGALNQELENLPDFRRYSYISAFGEGWALYCEKLGIEAGFYQSPYSDFGRLSYEMWRAARLVIDTGIHAFGWSRERAITLLEENSALSTHNIRTEVDRYISWPGQALSYKLGELKILELRQLAEKELGEKFDIRLFHDAILENGSIPLDILTAQIEKFIEAQKKSVQFIRDKL